MSTDPFFCANSVWWTAFQSGAFWASIAWVVMLFMYATGYYKGKR